MRAYKQHGKELISIEEFMGMSAAINYQLSAEQPDMKAILAKVFSGRPIMYMDPLLEAVKVLLTGYEGKSRELGTFAEIHPLRTTALLCRCMEEPSVLDLLGGLLHDVEEDLSPENMDPDRWKRLQDTLRTTRETIDIHHQWFLGERMALYRREPFQPYSVYLGNLLDAAPDNKPDLLHVKLADRLDNTLDTQLYLPNISNYNFYRFVFDLLFVPEFPGVKIDEYHFIPAAKQGVKLLSQLFKNTIFLSLIRQDNLEHLTPITHRLFNGLAVASIREAQWIALELFSSDIIDIKRQRELLLATMEYTHSGGVSAIRPFTDENLLDGTYIENFALVSSRERKEKLAELFLAKDQLTEIIIAFIATFSAFLNDPEFYIKGIGRKGIQPINEPKSSLDIPTEDE